MVSGEGITRLPEDIATSVGHIAHQFSLLEDILKQCIYYLVGVEGTVGRIAIGTARAEDQVSKIEDLLTHLGYTFDPPLSDFKKRVAKAERDRDSVIHGNWAKDPDKAGGLLLLDLKGNWAVGEKTPRVSRRMYPAGRPTSNEDLIDMLGELRTLNLDAWRGVYLRLPPLQGRSPLQGQPDRQTDDQTGNTSEDPPAPSRE